MTMEIWLRRAEGLVEAVGKGVSWIILVLIGAITYDVIMRYAFSSPTIWSFDLSYMLGGTLMLMGLSYAHKYRSHVRVDIFVKQCSPKVRVVLEVLFTAVFFLPLMAVLLQISFVRMVDAWEIGEISRLGMWHPSMVPFRVMMFVAFVLLALEGIAQLIVNAKRLFRGQYDG